MIGESHHLGNLSINYVVFNNDGRCGVLLHGEVHEEVRDPAIHLERGQKSDVETIRLFLIRGIAKRNVADNRLFVELVSEFSSQIIAALG